MARNTRFSDPASPPPSEEQAAAYDRHVPMLEAAHREMTELSKKKPDGVVNTLKIKVINRLLAELSTVLEDDASRGFVDMLEEDSLPQNSDVVLVLSQWQAALTQYKATHHGYDASRGNHRWFTTENPGSPYGD
jgi:hypothetical protein